MLDARAAATRSRIRVRVEPSTLALIVARSARRQDVELEERSLFEQMGPCSRAQVDAVTVDDELEAPSRSVAPP